jgi:hypothetical protein
VSVFHALNEVTAVQAFVAKNMPIQNGSASWVNRDVRYGLAVQRPLSTYDNDPLRNVYLSVGALGQSRLDGPARPVVEMLPGLHYKAGENWWISGAMAMPVGSLGTSQSWQVTCSVQF